MSFTTFILTALALSFDFINGFHDAANSVAAIVASGVLPRKWAPLWAGIFNATGFLFFGIGVAKTVGSGMIDLHVVTPEVIAAGLLAAITFDLITWWYGLPTSSSHALIAGYAGAAFAKAGMPAIILSGWSKTIIFMLGSPVACLTFALALSALVKRLVNNFKVDSAAELKWSRYIQFFTAAAFSSAHGAGDALKTAGIIASLWFVTGFTKSFQIPIYLVIMVHLAIGLGTWLGGWRITDFVAFRTTKQKTTPLEGACAEATGFLAVALALYLKVPASSTLCVVPALDGSRMSKGLDTVVWPKVIPMWMLWFGTIPICGLLGIIWSVTIKVILSH